MGHCSVRNRYFSIFLTRSWGPLGRSTNGLPGQPSPLGSLGRDRFPRRAASRHRFTNGPACARNCCGPMRDWWRLRTGTRRPITATVTGSGFCAAARCGCRRRENRGRPNPGNGSSPPHGVTKQDFSDDARILSLHFRCQWPTGENLFAEATESFSNRSNFRGLKRSAAALQHLVRRHFPKIRGQFSLQGGDLTIFLRLQQLFFPCAARFLPRDG